MMFFMMFFAKRYAQPNSRGDKKTHQERQIVNFRRRYYGRRLERHTEISCRCRRRSNGKGQ
jgi:hypothetical protein